MTVEQSPRRRLLFSAVTIGLALTSAAVIGETALRALGFTPFSRVEPGPVTVLKLDPKLGWKPVPGEYDMRYLPGEPAVRVTILPDGSRKTSDDPPDNPEVLLVGGSFTFGFGLADSDSFAWKLQAADFSRRYVNRAVSAYSGYQSLLTMEARLEQDPPPAAVLYGFIQHHEMRNVAHGQWMARLTRAGYGGKTPYCDIDASGRLLRFAPAGPTPMPFRESSALTNLLDQQFQRVRTHWRALRARDVQLAIFRAMDDACRRAGARFGVLILTTLRDLSVEIDMLDREGIPYVDLRRPMPQELRLPNDSHPNRKLTTIWARELAPFIDSLVERGAPGPPGR